jgi:hypothetical protein
MTYSLGNWKPTNCSQLRARLRPGPSAPPRKQTTHRQGNNPTTTTIATTPTTPTTARTPTRTDVENTTHCTIHPAETRPSPRSICAMGSRKRVKPNPAAGSNSATPAPTPTALPSAMPLQSSSKSPQPRASATEEDSPPTPKPGGSGNGTPTPGQGSRQACVPLYLLAGLRRSTDAAHGTLFLTA